MSLQTPHSRPVVLITGGSAGIGAAYVRKFLAEGSNVSVLALPDGDLQWLASENVLVTPGDVTLEQDREMAIQRVLNSYGRLDVLINNAGVGLYGLATETPSDLFSRLLAVYSASKSALHAVHDALRVELRRTPIHLVKVCPGIVDTEFRKHVLSGDPPERVRKLRWVVSSEAVACAIFRAVQRRKKSVYVPAVAGLFGRIGQLAPGLMDLYLARFLSDRPLGGGPDRKELSRANDA